MAARIGQQLLARNKSLEEKNSTLENELCVSAEKITQLKHDLLMKTDLLQIYTNDVDDSSVDCEWFVAGFTYGFPMVMVWVWCGLGYIPKVKPKTPV